MGVKHYLLWSRRPHSGSIWSQTSRTTLNYLSRNTSLYLSGLHLSVERKVFGFSLTTLHDWLKKLAPVRKKAKTNPRFASATCSCFEFWLVNRIDCVLCDWLEWFWVYHTQLKTTEVCIMVTVGASIHFSITWSV